MGHICNDIAVAMAVAVHGLVYGLYDRACTRIGGTDVLGNATFGRANTRAAMGDLRKSDLCSSR